jgi:hypothetical protein
MSAWIIKTMSSSKIYIHVGNAFWELQNFRKTGEEFTGTAQVASNDDVQIYNKALEKNNFRVERSDPLRINQIHFFVNELRYSGEEMVFSKENIEKVQVLDKNKALTTFSFIAGTAASAFGAIVIFLLIACNCPHIYINDGLNWHFTNSLFTGALNQKLERFDFKRIPDFHKTNSDLHLEIRNEEQEIQYINQLSLIAVYHKLGQEILCDQEGNFFIVKNKLFPEALKDDFDNTIDLSKINHSELSYSFKSSDHSGFSNLYGTFDNISKRYTHINMSVKNTRWGAFVYKEFTKLFGDNYQRWVQNNARKDLNELHTNMEKAGIFMRVEINDNGKWRFLENINLIGEAGFQNILITIPDCYQNHNEIKIRIRTGYHFWEINHLSLIETENDQLEIDEYHAQVIGENASDYRKKLLENDGEYLIHHQGAQAIQVYFEGLQTEKPRTLFLKSKGYYKGTQIQTGKTQWGQLLSINREGGFSKFSKELYQESMAWESVLNELGFSLFASHSNIKN